MASFEDLRLKNSAHDTSMYVRKSEVATLVAVREFFHDQFP